MALGPSDENWDKKTAPFNGGGIFPPLGKNAKSASRAGSANSQALSPHEASASQAISPHKAPAL